MIPSFTRDDRVPGYGVTMKHVHRVRDRLRKCLTDNAAAMLSLDDYSRAMRGTGVIEYMNDKQALKLEVSQGLEALTILASIEGSLEGWWRFTTSEGMDHYEWFLPPEMQ